MTKIEYIARYGEDAYKEHISKCKKNYQDNIEKRIEYNKQYYNNNKEKCLEYNKQYRINNKEKCLIYDKQYRIDNKEKKQKYNILYYQKNKEKLNEQYKHYSNETQNGRANSLVRGYRRDDKKHNRGECTLTTDWIVNNIFTSKCIFCGESDWHKLGCDRIDNSLPHTPDNVQCCCGECNVKKQKMTNEEFINKITN